MTHKRSGRKQTPVSGPNSNLGTYLKIDCQVSYLVKKLVLKLVKCDFKEVFAHLCILYGRSRQLYYYTPAYLSLVIGNMDAGREGEVFV